MSLDRRPGPTITDLCGQCRFLFSSGGFAQLASAGSFRHSQIGTFVDRPYCRFCRFLWNEDLLGSSSQVYKIRCLRDLLSPVSQNTHSRKFEELQRCWVVVSRPTANQYIMGSYAMISSIEPYTVSPDLIIGNAIDRVFVSVETEKGQMKWQAFSPLRLVAPKCNV